MRISNENAVGKTQFERYKDEILKDARESLGMQAIREMKDGQKYSIVINHDIDKCDDCDYCCTVRYYADIEEIEEYYKTVHLEEEKPLYFEEENIVIDSIIKALVKMKVNINHFNRNMRINYFNLRLRIKFYIRRIKGGKK